jgi:pyruvate/2-oxoglutarate dehydrogenase complex dihydrolipoamide dehydrogenase (E3) component
MAFDYDLIVIGGGAAGLTSSAIGSTLGARTLMIERDRLGGDCTWYGCIPSKTLLKGARVAKQMQEAGRYGLTDRPVSVAFGKIMDHVRAVRERVYEEADAPDRFERLGVEVRFGEARFLDHHRLEIKTGSGPERVSGRSIIIATGASASVPPIPGLANAPFLTNETLFELENQPESLVIVGAGPMGLEMAQAFARFGSRVTVVDMLDRILSRGDREIAEIVRKRLLSEGVEFHLKASIDRVESSGEGVSVTVSTTDETKQIVADALLLAAGRRPNVDSLALDRAGVRASNGGIDVNRRCRTNVRHIFAVGDVTGRYQLTHMSEHMAKVAVSNALLKVPAKIDERHVPWVTFTDPEIAHVGATENELIEKGIRFRTYRFPYSKIDRAVTDSEADGLIKVYARELTGRILGADIAGASAGELISEYALAMKNRIPLRKIADTIHPYPTYALGARRAADQWYVQKRAPWMTRLIKAVFRYRGPVIEFGDDEIL